MKKRIFLFVTILAILACLLAVTISAAEPSYADGEWIYADDGVTKLAIRDTEGNPLIWYMNGDVLKYVRADQTDETESVYVKYSISAGCSNIGSYVSESCLKDIDIYDNGTQIEGSSINSQIVLFNMERLTIDTINGWLFGNKNGCCTLMRGMVFPSTLKYIGQEGLTNTKMVQYWNLENTQLTYINACDFAATSTLTQEATNGVLRLPFTLNVPLSAQKAQIKTYIMNPYSTFNYNQLWNQYFRQCSKLEKIYAPASVAMGFGQEALRDTSKYLIMLCGTEEDAQNLIANTPNNNWYNDSLKKAEIISYETYISDPATYDDANKAYVVYGCNFCDNFYDGKHDNGESCEYESFYENGKHTVGCTRDCGVSTTTELLPIFYSLGYSHTENDKYAIMQGFAVNKEALDFYNSYNPDAQISEFGLLAGSKANLDLVDGEIFDANGEVAETTKVAYRAFSDENYVVFEMKISGLEKTKEVEGETIVYADLEIFNCAYYLVKNVDAEGNVTYTSMYMDANGITETLTNAVTYNGLANKAVTE